MLSADLEAAPATVTKMNVSENLDIVELKNSALSKLSEGDEPILKRNHKRFVLFPIQYHEVIGQY